MTVDQTGEETVCTDNLCVVDGLENGRSYDVSVQAVNDVGRSVASSSRAVTPAGAPSVPSDVTAAEATDR